MNEVVVTCKQLWSHVDGSPNNAARHHGLWFAKTQICDLCTILFVQLKGKKREQDGLIKLCEITINMYEIKQQI